MSEGKSLMEWAAELADKQLRMYAQAEETLVDERAYGDVFPIPVLPEPRNHEGARDMGDKKRVRIHNETGIGYTTKVTDTETGEDLPGVSHISISISPRDSILAHLTVHAPVIDIVADADIKQVCPCCGRPVEKESDET